MLPRIRNNKYSHLRLIRPRKSLIFLSALKTTMIPMAPRVLPPIFATFLENLHLHQNIARKSKHTDRNKKKIPKGLDLRTLRANQMVRVVPSVLRHSFTAFYKESKFLNARNSSFWTRSQNFEPKSVKKNKNRLIL